MKEMRGQEATVSKWDAPPRELASGALHSRDPEQSKWGYYILMFTCVTFNSIIQKQQLLQMFEFVFFIW